MLSIKRNMYIKRLKALNVLEYRGANIYDLTEKELYQAYKEALRVGIRIYKD